MATKSNITRRTAKQIARENYLEVYNAACAHYGVPADCHYSDGYRFACYYGKNATADVIAAAAQCMQMRLTQPTPEATAKQMLLIKRNYGGNPSLLEKIGRGKWNKFNASYLISLLIDEDRLVYARYASKDEFEFLEAEQQKVIEMALTL